MKSATDHTIKQQLADAYRILAYLGLDDHTYTHLSARAPDSECFYIYPFGMRFEEVRVEHLLTVGCDGTIHEGEEYQYNRTGYIIHGSIYQARADIQAIFHIHTPEIVAVSACQEGLLPISQWALHFYDHLAYHDYNALALESHHGNDLIADLGSHYSMLLRHHGSITCGKTIEEAMFYTYHLQQACKTQCLALAMNHPLKRPSESICTKAVQDLLGFEANLGARDWQAWLRVIARHSGLRAGISESFSITVAQPGHPASSGG